LDALVARAGDALVARPVSGAKPHEAAKARLVSDLLALEQELMGTHATSLPEQLYRSVFSIQQTGVDLCARAISLMADLEFSTTDLWQLHANINEGRVAVLHHRIALTQRPLA